jgi:hypothetical protein
MSLRHWAPSRKFFAHLEQCDRQIADQVAAKARCAECGGKLHRADFPRRPRGCLGLLAGPVRRVSFCCAERQCRRRLTPPSFRFADRKWFALFVVLLAAALGPRGPEHVTGQVDVAGASPSLRSVRRWQRFFRLEFAISPAWQWLRGRLSRPPPDAGLPLGLLCCAQSLGHTEPAATIGETINWLAQAGLGCRVAQFDGSITIRRVWHC